MFRRLRLEGHGTRTYGFLYSGGSYTIINVPGSSRTFASSINKDRAVLFPTSFRGELAQYLVRQQAQGTPYLFESNRHRPYSTRRLRQLVKHYAMAAGITKRVYPHLFRHQLITYSVAPPSRLFPCLI